MAVRPAGKLLLALLFGGFFAASGQSAAATPPPPVPFPIATNVRLGGDGTQTRFVMDLTRNVAVHAFTLADPYRVVLDIPEVVFRLPPRAGESGRGLIKAFRYGLMMEGGSRIVLDVTKPVRVDKAFVVDAAAGDPARLVLDLTATDRQSFLRTMALADKLATSELPPPTESGRKPGDHRPVVMLDPGHGGIDTGTVAPTGQEEKNIVLDVAKRVRAQLEKLGKYRVLMTRTTDTYVPLDERVRMARAAGASLFVSIHADALPRREGNARGATLYTLSNKASDSQAAAVAEKENRSDVIAGVDLKREPSDVAGILLDLAQRETKTFSVQFAHTLLHDMDGVALLHKDPLKAAGFRVLRAPDVPSVLIELGYVSNRRDLKSLMSDAWRQRTADAIAKAIDGYISGHAAAEHAAAEHAMDGHAAAERAAAVHAGAD
jgi:N-acetylmuramoyl-L-alanine amidase